MVCVNVSASRPTRVVSCRVVSCRVVVSGTHGIDACMKPIIHLGRAMYMCGYLVEMTIHCSCASARHTLVILVCCTLTDSHNTGWRCCEVPLHAMQADAPMASGAFGKTAESHSGSTTVLDAIAATQNDAARADMLVGTWPKSTAPRELCCTTGRD
jgi:hypothetical protein